MMSWDTSALVRALVFSETGFDRARSLLSDQGRHGGSLLLIPEIAGAVVRRCGPDRWKADALLRRLEPHWKSFSLVPMDEPQARGASKLARRHGLRGADAVHLSAALFLASVAGRRTVRFVTADVEQSAAARAEGLRVIEL